MSLKFLERVAVLFCYLAFQILIPQQLEKRYATDRLMIYLGIIFYFFTLNIKFKSDHKFKSSSIIMYLYTLLCATPFIFPIEPFMKKYADVIVVFIITATYFTFLVPPSKQSAKEFKKCINIYGVYFFLFNYIFLNLLFKAYSNYFLVKKKTPFSERVQQHCLIFGLFFGWKILSDFLVFRKIKKKVNDDKSKFWFIANIIFTFGFSLLTQEIYLITSDQQKMRELTYNIEEKYFSQPHNIIIRNIFNLSSEKIFKMLASFSTFIVIFK